MLLGYKTGFVRPGHICQDSNLCLILCGGMPLCQTNGSRLTVFMVNLCHSFLASEVQKGVAMRN